MYSRVHVHARTHTPQLVIAHLSVTFAVKHSLTACRGHNRSSLCASTIPVSIHEGSLAPERCISFVAVCLSRSTLSNPVSSFFLLWPCRAA